MFSQNLVSQTLIFAHWPSSLQLFPTADHFLRALLAASVVPSLLGRQPPGAKADVAQAQLLAAGRGLRSEFMTGSFGKGVYVPPFETSGLKSRMSRIAPRKPTVALFSSHFGLPVELLEFFLCVCEQVENN